MSAAGEYIRQKRATADISLRKLGDIAGISSTEMMKIENGTRKNPSWQTLCKIAAALKFHPFEILAAAGYISDDDINPNVKITGLDRLSNDEITAVQLFIDFIADRHSGTRKEE